MPIPREPKFCAPDHADGRFKGGRMIVTRSGTGWEISHEPAAGGEFPCNYDRVKARAVAYAEARARHFGARLFVEQPIA